MAGTTAWDLLFMHAPVLVAQLKGLSYLELHCLSNPSNLTSLRGFSMPSPCLGRPTPYADLTLEIRQACKFQSCRPLDHQPALAA